MGAPRQTFRRAGNCARDARDWDDGRVGDQAGTATEEKAGLRAAVIAARRALPESARADAASLLTEAVLTLPEVCDRANRGRLYLLRHGTADR